MQDGIVIKSSKAGMTVILNPDMPFAELLASVAKKFGDSARFWGSAQMTLTSRRAVSYARRRISDRKYYHRKFPASDPLPVRYRRGTESTAAKKH